LAQQALRKVDAWWDAHLAPTDAQLKDEKYIKALAAADALPDQAGKNNSFRVSHALHDSLPQGFFTSQGNQFYDPTSLADYYETSKANVDFYREYVHSGITGDSSNPLYTKVFDYYKEELKDALKGIKDDPRLIRKLHH